MYTNGENDEDGYEENDKGEGMYTNGEFVEDGDEECGEGENDKVEGMCGEDFFLLDNRSHNYFDQNLRKMRKKDLFTFDGGVRDLS